ncbi:MAG: DUF1289 domain-containing protein [Porticoccus sp.]|jgi:predicted Fe-S protein YdhL (DUF1289 family)|uniref:DUF1289 domain-containing protein n=1 Tax=Porticoccus sp. Uisw_050_02 TaxID=3230978 RepID=UPI001DD18993|nr:DUF1289 domain-containing protein [Porticoccus sp.]
MANIVPSPCVSVCAMSEEDICVGCYRTSREIREWMLMEDRDRLKVIENAFQRSQKNNPFA